VHGGRGCGVLTSTVTRKVAAQMAGSRYVGSAPDRSVNQKRPPSLKDGRFSDIRRICRGRAGAEDHIFEAHRNPVHMSLIPEGGSQYDSAPSIEVVQDYHT
jgi:hypothetical protein